MFLSPLLYLSLEMCTVHFCDEPLIVSGDSKYDSPGHSVSYKTHARSWTSSRGGTGNCKSHRGEEQLLALGVEKPLVGRVC